MSHSPDDPIKNKWQRAEKIARGKAPKPTSAKRIGAKALRFVSEQISAGPSVHSAGYRTQGCFVLHPS